MRAYKNSELINKELEKYDTDKQRYTYLSSVAARISAHCPNVSWEDCMQAMLNEPEVRYFQKSQRKFNMKSTR